MAYKIRTLSKADKDIASAVEWYLEIESSLAARFIEQLDNSFKLLKDFPEAFPIVHLDLRMYVLKTFPYKIVYLVDTDTVIIHAVKHHKQHPQKWQK